MLYRERFPIFRNKTYINSCSYAALSIDVREAFEQYLSDRDEYGSHWEFWVEKLDNFRASLATFLGAETNEIAINSCLSNGVNALANSLDFNGERNKLVVTDFDFPTTAQIWRAQARRGAELVQVESTADDMTIPLSHFEEKIDEKTLLVSIPHVCYRNGSKLDIASIIKIAHSRGALAFVDSYQAVGTTPINVKQLDADFLAGGTLKYLLASAGVGFLYARQSLVESLNPTTSGWFAQANVHAMDAHHNDPAPNARRFESGTPTVPNLYAADAGLALLEKVGVEQAEEQIRTLTGEIKNRAAEAGYKLGMPAEDDRHGALITLGTHDMYKLVSLLQEKNIITSCRDNNLRISPHFYNNLDDIAQLFSELKAHRALLK